MYKLYQSRKKIPWINPNMQDVPNPDINDTWFNFELLENTGMYFESWDSGKIVVKSNDITYFKIENDVDNTKRYFYVESVAKVLKTGFELNVRMDVYMTHIKNFIKTLNGERPLIQRCSITPSMFHNSESLRRTLYFSFRLEDEMISDLKNQYSHIEFKEKPVHSFPLTLHYSHRTGTSTVGLDYGPYKVNENNFSWNSGIYCVMLRAKGGVFDLYPLQKNETYWSLGQALYNMFNVSDYNNLGVTEWFSNSMEILTGYVASRTDINYNNKNAAQTLYGQNAFQGFFKGPVDLFYPSRDRSDDSIGFEMDTIKMVTQSVDFPSLKKSNLCGFVSLDPLKPKQIKLPVDYTIDVDDGIEKLYTTLLEPVVWGKTEVIPAKLFALYEKNRNQNNFSIKYNVSFSNGFIATPEYNILFDETDAVSWGEQIPSASAEYGEQLRKIEAGYNVGLANANFGVVQGILSAGGKWAASPLWGITSLGNTLATYGRDRYNLSVNKKNQIAGAGATYINSSTTNWWYMSMFVNYLKDYGYLNSYAESKNAKQLIDTCYIKRFTEEQKHQIIYLLTKYGFKVNNSINYTDWINNLSNTDKAFIQFDELWIQNTLNSVITHPLPFDIYNIISQILSNGIRINMEWV